MKVLVIDIGEANVKVLLSGQKTPQVFPSGPTLTPRQMVCQVRKIAANWNYDVVSIGYPGLVLRGQEVMQSQNLGRGWVGFDFHAAFSRQVKIINEAAMEALGTYKGGRMLFLGLGTGVESVLVVNGKLISLKLGHLPYQKGSFDDYLGIRGIQRLGKKKWGRHVAFGVAHLIAALHAEDLVLGGANAKKLKQLPAGCRAGDNADVFLGGFRLWENVGGQKFPAHARFVPEETEGHGYGTAHTVNFEAAH
jgi:polyphosphate glucokinase